MSFGGGGGGNGNLSGDSDVALSNPADGQILAFNGTLSKWQNNTPSYSGEPATRVRFSSLSGSTDDAKLANFISAASTGTNGYHGRVLVMDEMRTYSFTTQQTVYSGFAMVSGGRATDQARSSLPISNKLSLAISGGTGTGGWLVLPGGNVYGIYMEGLSFDGNSTSRVFDPNASAVIWTSVFRDISMQNIASFMGSSTQYQPWDLCTFEGFWNLNNIRDIAWSVGGSDSTIAISRGNIDCPNTLGTASQTLMGFTSNSKCMITGIYVTCDQKSGLLLSTSSSQREMVFLNCIWEGRNTSTPCYGALIRGTSNVSFRNCRFAYAMSGGSNGRTDKGYLYQTGGAWYVDNCTYELATGGTSSTVMHRIDAGTARLTNAKTEGLSAPFDCVVSAPSGGTTVIAGNMTTYTFGGGHVTFDDTWTLATS